MEETHNFTFDETTVHIGAERAQAVQAEYEKECRQYSEQIVRIEGTLRTKGQ